MVVTQSEFTFRGLMAPVFAPFKDDLTLNLDIIDDYAKFLDKSNIKGILVHGTTGEGTSLNVKERKQITESWIKAVKITGQHLMVQVGGAPLPDVLELTKHAESVGADSIITLPELYNKPKTSNELIRYLKLVAKVAPKTPLLYYHIPVFSNVTINMGDFLSAIVGEIPTFHGIKFASFSLDEGVSALKNGGNNAIFLGADQIMSGAFCLGFDSAIATTFNIFPHLAINILESVKQSNLSKAQKAQDTLTRLCSIIAKNGSFVSAMKVAMNLLTPINVGKTREPLMNLTTEHIKEMEAALKNIH